MDPSAWAQLSSNTYARGGKPRPPPQMPAPPVADYNPFLDLPASTQPPQPAYPIASAQSAYPQATASYPAYPPAAAARPPPQPAYPSYAHTAPPAAASTNPFDQLDFNDDAGFFSNVPSPIAKASAAASSTGPTVEQQRLCRSASMLFERGLLIPADKNLLQDLILSGNQAALAALEAAERDGNMRPLEQVFIKARGGHDSDSDSSLTKKQTGGTFKDSDDEDGQTEGAGDSRRESWAVAASTLGKQPGVEPPHPAAGGYSAAQLPQGMAMVRGAFTGSILLRVSSKMMFRKWKSVYFSLDLQRMSIFDTKRDAEMGLMPRLNFTMHACMWVAKPSLKKTYSLIDDGRRVYYSTLKENSREAISAASMSGMERPVTYTPGLEQHVVAKFASYYPNEISAMAHALYSVVVYHQKEAKKARDASQQKMR